MLKPLSLSVGLAVALGACSLSLAGGHHGTYASEQSAPSAQSVVPSAQSIGEGCGEVCGPVKKKCDFFSKFKPKPHQYTYEWVLKKKKVHQPLFGHKNKGCGTGTCGASACETCGVAPSAQSYGSGQSYGTGQNLGTTQIPATYSVPQGGYSVPQGGPAAPTTEAPATEAPVAPTIPAAPPAPTLPATPPTASTGGLQLLPAGN